MSFLLVIIRYSFLQELLRRYFFSAHDRVEYSEESRTNLVKAAGGAGEVLADAEGGFVGDKGDEGDNAAAGAGLEGDVSKLGDRLSFDWEPELAGHRFICTPPLILKAT